MQPIPPTSSRQARAATLAGHGARQIGASLIAAACAGLAPCAFAAHPLQTEDTGTQGTGNVELENGLSWTRAAGDTVFVYQPQLSCGLGPSLDLIVQPSWIRTPAARGAGDTNLDAKWRFYGAAPWSFGVRAGAALATGASGLGLPHRTMGAHGVLVATYDEAPVTVHFNLGADRHPSSSGLRQVVPRVSSALMFAASEQLIWTVDVGASAGTDPMHHAWSETLLGGLIYTVIPNLDLDLGVQVSANARPRTRQWLMGFTYRFAP